MNNRKYYTTYNNQYKNSSARRHWPIDTTHYKDTRNYKSTTGSRGNNYNKHNTSVWCVCVVTDRGVGNESEGPQRTTQWNHLRDINILF